MPPKALTNFIWATDTWQDQVSQDEWFFARWNDRMVAALTPAEAFEAIDDLVAVMLETRDPDLSGYCAVTLLALARHADTTQMPPALERSFDRLTGSIDKHDAEALRRWYKC